MPRVLSALLALALLIAPARADGPPQFRAFWVDGFNPGFKTPQQVDRLVAHLKSLHMNAVVVQVRKRGDAMFRKSVEPFADDPGVPADFDPLADLLDKARGADIQVHCWVNVSTIWTAGGAPRAPDHVFNQHGVGKQGRVYWLTQDDEGRNRYETGHSVDAGHPDYQSHFVRVCVELAKAYPVDGIHFDYVRYPETPKGDGLAGAAGYNPTNVLRFNLAHGRTGMPGRNDPAWNDWRRQQVTQLVRRARVELMEAKPNVLLSAALIPWGDGPADEAAWTKTAPFAGVFQDWHNWRREGLLDLTVPMNYDREERPDHKAFYDHWIAFEKKYRYGTKSLVGVGAYMNSLPDALAQVRRALAADGAAPADGVCLYNYNHFNRPRGDGPSLDDLRKALVEGPNAPFATPAKRPEVPRLTAPTTGVVAGVVKRGDGQPLDSKAVSVEAAGGPATVALTDGNGFFAVVGLKPGKYTVVAPATGLKQEVDVVAGKVTRVK